MGACTSDMKTFLGALNCFTFLDLVESQGLEHVAAERTMPGGTGALKLLKYASESRNTGEVTCF